LSVAENIVARKPTTSQLSKTLTLLEKQSAISRLESRISELHQLDISQLSRGDDPPVADIAGRIRSTLAIIYGQTSAEYERLGIAADLDATIYSYTERTPTQEIRQGVDRGRKRAISALQGEVDALKEDVQFTASNIPIQPIAQKTEIISTPVSNSIFVVHGRDDSAKIEVARLIERAGLEAIILHEQANGGRTIIQKFEDHGGAAGFAIVIMTPDDVGGLNENSLQARARQNVIGEMFWFAGRLGRERVCALKKGAIEVPTDFAGVGYVDMDSTGAWKKDVLRELEHAGYKGLDWQRALA
jgi:predicted nucleotide-binding protein